MIKRKRALKSRGILTPDAAEDPQLIRIAREAGWKITRISSIYRDSPDDTIALKYGKGRSILLTYDKTFYKNNPLQNGFSGIIEHDVVLKKEFADFSIGFMGIMSSLTAEQVKGYRVVIDYNARTFKKISLLKSRARSTK